MNVAGIDYSTRFVDIVTVSYEGTGAPVWHRYPLTGNDAFDRARSVGETVPGRHGYLWDDILAVGIEHPGGNHGTGALLRVQGAILARIPATMLVHPLPPGKWRKLVGLPGNASKRDVAFSVRFDHPDFPLYERVTWTQDACDAYCIALATRSLIDTKQAA